MNSYYQSCAIPKPGSQKKKRTVNGFKHKAERVCYYCGAPGAERHEVYGGANRQTSIDHGFQVDLCPDCHRELHENTTERAKLRNHYWRGFYQTQYEDKLMASGLSAEKARELWLTLIGRNYRI